MRGINKYLAGAVLSASLLFSSAAQAMQIPQFDKMSIQQKGEYTVYLIQSAMQYLRNQGHPEQADAVWKLFETNDPTKGPPAVAQLAGNLNAARNLNQQHANDPNYKPIQVEHVVALTLKQHGYIVPPDQLLLASQNYKPGAPAPIAQNIKPASPSGN